MHTEGPEIRKEGRVVKELRTRVEELCLNFFKKKYFVDLKNFDRKINVGTEFFTVIRNLIGLKKMVMLCVKISVCP